MGEAKVRSTEELVEVGRQTMSLSYNPAPIILESGEGMWVTDRDGKRYLDFLAGIAVSTLGHGHPAVVEAIRDQAGKVLHISNAFFSAPQVELQERLTQLCFADRVFFTNSGAEANEAALKLARRYQQRVKNNGRFEIISFLQSFHGRTMGAISATGQPKYHDGFEPMVPGCLYATFNDLSSVEAVVGAHTAAILVEPVQGEGGIRPATPEFLKGLREICDREGIVLIFDEVQCGVGRTGEWFAHQAYGVEPDIMTLAKGIGGGVPIGAMLANGEVATGFKYGSHATTYGGNPLATRVALTVLDTMASEGILENVRAVGSYLRGLLEELVSERSELLDVRGAGLMLGVETDSADTAKSISVAAREAGLLMNTAGGVVLRFVPPLVATREDAAECVRRLREALS